jgi:hypothetical protein
MHAGGNAFQHFKKEALAKTANPPRRTEEDPDELGQRIKRQPRVIIALPEFSPGLTWNDSLWDEVTGNRLPETVAHEATSPNFRSAVQIIGHLHPVYL